MGYRNHQYWPYWEVRAGAHSTQMLAMSKSDVYSLSSRKTEAKIPRTTSLAPLNDKEQSLATAQGSAWQLYGLKCFCAFIRKDLLHDLSLSGRTPMNTYYDWGHRQAFRLESQTIGNRILYGLPRWNQQTILWSRFSFQDYKCEPYNVGNEVPFFTVFLESHACAPSTF